MMSLKSFRLHLFLFCAAVTCVFATGCATVREVASPRTASPASAEKQSAPDAATAPKKVGGDLLHAFLNNNSKKFLGLLPEVVSEEFGEKGFRDTRESMLNELGTPLSYSYVCNLEHPTFTVSIWKIKFERKSSDGKKTIRQESMFRAVSGKVDDEERLLSFNFF